MNALPLFRDMDPEVLTINLPGPSFTALSSKYTPEGIIITLYDNEKYALIAVTISGFDERSQVLGMICDNSDTLLVALTKYAASERVLGDTRAHFTEYTAESENVDKRKAHLESVKGLFCEGYTGETIEEEGNLLRAETGINIQVIWDYKDHLGLGGDSEIMISRDNGRCVLYYDTVGISEWLLAGEGNPEDILRAWDRFGSDLSARYVGCTRAYDAKQTDQEHNWYILRKY